ncbi:hypothetical protein N9933_00480 [bacterium]|nr:hypothetical protein [bacterium]
MLHFEIYQQQFKTWWNDSDGDKHHHSTIYANLRFYENGTVIGVRSSGIPNLNVPKSFTLKGKWEANDNNLDFTLEKVSEADDSIEIYISDEDERQMKYYGEIANDDSLIKAGIHKGTVKENAIHVGNFVFSKLPTSTLIVTATEDTCNQLETQIKDAHCIIDTFQDTGNWYTNGETGPEWFTVHIRTASGRTKEVEELVNQAFKKMGKSSGNLYWG